MCPVFTFPVSRTLCHVVQTATAVIHCSACGCYRRLNKCSLHNSKTAFKGRARQEANVRHYKFIQIREQTTTKVLDSHKRMCLLVRLAKEYLEYVFPLQSTVEQKSKGCFGRATCTRPGKENNACPKLCYSKQTGITCRQ